MSFVRQVLACLPGTNERLAGRDLPYLAGMAEVARGCIMACEVKL